MRPTRMLKPRRRRPALSRLEAVHPGRSGPESSTHDGGLLVTKTAYLIRNKILPPLRMKISSVRLEPYALHHLASSCSRSDQVWLILCLLDHDLTSKCRLKGECVIENYSIMRAYQK